MSTSHQYHRPNIADSPLGSDSEEDLDLQELDPATSSDPPHEHGRTSREENRKPNGYGAGIALRNLRMGTRSRMWRRDGSSRRRGEEDDLEGLLQDKDEAGQRDSQGSSGLAEDDAPLLQPGRRRRRQFQEEQTNLSKLGSRLRLPSLRSTSALEETLHQATNPPDEIDEPDPKASREVLVGQSQQKKFPANVVSNAKYTPWSFLPRTLYNEFSFFLNMYFLLVALSQIIPILRIGYMSTYTVPLATVLAITLGKEAIDDIARRRRDAEANAEGYTVLSFGKSGAARGNRRARRQARDSRAAGGQEGVHEITKKSRDLKVGDILKLRKDQRLPADVIILKSTSSDQSVTEPQPVQNEEVPSNLAPDWEASSSEPSGNQALPDQEQARDTQETTAEGDSGETFIRTDQLDGETDWKLRLPSPLTQSMRPEDFKKIRISAGAPDKKVNDFVGTIEVVSEQRNGYDPHVNRHQSHSDLPNGHAVNNNQSELGSRLKSVPLTIDNTAWANTVLASNTTTLAAVIYTGRQTRSAMSTSPSRSKTGLLEYEINNLTKILCAMTLTLSIVLVALEGFEPSNKQKWYNAILIYLILFSTIIPISLRVNLDMGKTVYAWFIERDQGIPGTVVRTSTIPEDLGRIEYLLSDKTGTLTQNGECTHLRPSSR